MIQVQIAILVGENNQAFIAGRPGGFPVRAQVPGIMLLIKSLPRATGKIIHLDTVQFDVGVGLIHKQLAAAVGEAVIPDGIAVVLTVKQPGIACLGIKHTHREAYIGFARKCANDGVDLQLTLAIIVNFPLRHVSPVLQLKTDLAAIGPPLMRFHGGICVTGVQQQPDLAGVRWRVIE